MSILARVAVLALALVILPIIVSADGDTTTFKVDSYIPVLFRDIQWTITGQADVSGNGNHNYNAPGDNQYGTRASSHLRHFGAGTDWRKTYITRPLSWNLGILANVSYTGENELYRSDVITPYRTSHGRDSMASDVGAYYLRLFGSVNPYLSGDFFLSLSGDMYANINRTYNANGVGSGSSVDSTYQNLVTTEDRSYMREGNNTYETYYYSATVGAGWGRVYYGNYAATALYMIEELRNHGQLISLPERSVMDSLAEMIYRFRNTHAIDSRLRRIEALGAIAKFLRAHGVTDMADPVSGLYLQDVWDYFPNDSRRFGFIVQLSAGVRDSRNWHGSGQRVSNWDHYVARAINTDSIVDTFTYSSNYSDESHYSSRSNSPVISGSISYYRPISLRTQLDARVTGNYYLDPTSRSSYSTQVTDHDYDAACDISLDYIFSSRTRGRLGANVLYATAQSVTYQPNYYIDGYNRSRNDLGRFSLSGTLQYRIAIPTTLNGTLRYSAYKENDRYYYDSNTPRSTGHDYTLSISITHALY